MLRLHSMSPHTDGSAGRAERHRPRRHVWSPPLPADFTGTILVTTSDVPMLDAATLHDLLVHDQHPRPAITVLTATVPDPTGYGRIVRNPNGEVLSIVEQADASAAEKAITEVNSGVYAFDAAQLRRSLQLLDTNNEQGELY